MNRRRITIASIVLALIVGAVCILPIGRTLLWRTYVKIRGRYTVQDRVEQFGRDARDRLRPHFASAGVNYPPSHVGLFAIKDRRVMQLYAGDTKDTLRFIVEYPVQGQSGQSGPKLRQGDRQVPEGLYRIESLNPNSMFHVSLRLNYPNDFDREKGRQDGRTDLGSHIMIHGKAASVGCLAMGDPVAEEIFTLAADVGVENISVVITPTDFRHAPDSPLPASQPAWTAELYEAIKTAGQRFPSPTTP